MSRLRSLSRGGRLLLALAVGGAVFGIASVVQADIPDSGVIHGCYGKAGTPYQGNLRVIDADQGGQCRFFENSLTWNAAGVTGATGPTGPTGPSTNAFSTGVGGGGRLDVSGFVTVASLNVPAGKYAVTATAQVLNATVNGPQVNCRLADAGGTFGSNTLYAPPGPSEVMALQGTTPSPSASDTINLQCEAIVPGFAFIVQQTSIDAIQVATINGS